MTNIAVSRVRPAKALVPAINLVWRIVLGSASISVLLLAWFVVSQMRLVRPFLLPPLLAVGTRFLEDLLGGAFALNAGMTLWRAALGFALAAMVGIPLGILIARNRVVHWFCEPLVSIGFPTPKIAFLPIFMLWFGLYDLSKVIMIAFAAVFAIIAAAEAGTRGVDKVLIWSARSVGATNFSVFREVILPAALPQIFTGLQVALPIALITTIVTEMLMGGQGLGGAMMQAGSYADSVGVYSGIVETTLVGAIAVAAMANARRYLLRWHPEFNPR